MATGEERASIGGEVGTYTRVGDADPFKIDAKNFRTMSERTAGTSLHDHILRINWIVPGVTDTLGVKKVDARGVAKGLIKATVTMKNLHPDWQLEVLRTHPKGNPHHPGLVLDNPMYPMKLPPLKTKKFTIGSEELQRALRNVNAGIYRVTLCDLVFTRPDGDTINDETELIEVNVEVESLARSPDSGLVVEEREIFEHEWSKDSADIGYVDGLPSTLDTRNRTKHTGGKGSYKYAPLDVARGVVGNVPLYRPALADVYTKYGVHMLSDGRAQLAFWGQGTEDEEPTPFRAPDIENGVYALEGGAACGIVYDESGTDLALGASRCMFGGDGWYIWDYSKNQPKVFRPGYHYGTSWYRYEIVGDPNYGIPLYTMQNRAEVRSSTSGRGFVSALVVGLTSALQIIPLVVSGVRKTREAFRAQPTKVPAKPEEKGTPSPTPSMVRRTPMRGRAK